MSNSNICTISLASVFFIAIIYLLFIFTIPILEKAGEHQSNLIVVVDTAKSNLVKYVDAIEECPILSPRDVENLTIHDLRADDITYIMALGDSITAGFGAKGLRGKQIKKDHEFLNLYENRGLSFAIGGDENATSLAKFLNHYSRDGLIGASVGDHLTHICQGLYCLPYQYRPLQDRLNGAQSGAMANNLYTQVNYLLSQLAHEKVRRGSRFVNEKFKFLNLFIGNNDLCQSCNHINTPPENFEKIIRDTLDSIINKIPNTIVNLMGVFNVSQVYEVTRGQKYCRWYDVPYINFECTCAFAPAELGVRNRKIMDDLAAKYNEIIQNIVADYSKMERNDFAIVHNRFDLNLTTFPIDGLSNIDCFHPSKKSHEYISKVLWNSLVTPFKKREPVVGWDDSIKIRCFGEDDRIITY